MTTRTAPTSGAATTAAPGGTDAAQPCDCKPSDFGLTRAELRAEIRRCHATGWLLWELRHRFVNPSTVRERST